MYCDFDFKSFRKEVDKCMTKVFCESMEDYIWNCEQDGIDVEDCKRQEDIYCKMNKILDCPEMEKCHVYIYSLDRDNLNEEDQDKIEKLYECGVSRGMIPMDDEISSSLSSDDSMDCSDGICGGPSDSLTGQKLDNNPLPQIPLATPTSHSFTVLYSASKSGIGKMGNYYSNALDEEAAKIDCINTLEENGYADVSIMAVEHNNYDVENAPINDEYSDNQSFEMYEDDSSEYEKQETGDDSQEEVETQKEEDNKEEEVVDTNDNSTKDEEKVDDVDVDDEEEKDDEEEDAVEKDNTEDEKTDDTENSDTEEKDAVTDDENTEEKEDEDKKLTADEKALLKDEYTKIFKEVLGKTKLEKSIDDMTLEERTDFYTKMSEKWTKNDPSDFLTAKEQSELNKKVVKGE